MRFIVYGAGGVGGVIGARLYQAGHEVVLVARGAHLESLQRHGLQFESPEESLCLPIPAVDHPCRITLSDDDVVFLTVKSQHTGEALAILAREAGVNIPVICAQNGVANEPEAARRFVNVYGMMVALPANRLEPGVVECFSRHCSGVLNAGVYPHGVDERIAQVTDALSQAQFSARIDESIMRFKYAKLLRNLGNALEACFPPSDENARILERAQNEGIACLAAAGIDFAPAQEFTARVVGRIQQAPIRGRLRQGGSTWQSLARKQGSVEADYLNGEIALLGRQYDVPTPVNRALQLVAHQLCRRGAAPQSLSHTHLDLMIARLERSSTSACG